MPVAAIHIYLQVSALDFHEWSAVCYSQMLGQRNFSIMVANMNMQAWPCSGAVKVLVSYSLTFKFDLECVLAHG